MGLTTTIPSIAIQKLIPIVDTQIMKMFDISSYIEIAINSLPLNVKCNDPKVRDIKQQLDNVKQLILNINKIKKAMNTLSTSFNIISNVASTVEIIQLAIPAVPGVPQGPFAKLANIASTLGKNCKSSGKCLSSILSSIDLAVSKLESVLAFAIMKLTSICTNETFSVSANVQDELIKLSEQSKSKSSNSVLAIAAGLNSTALGSNSGEFAGYNSKFYNEYNVSQDDLDALQTIVYDLNELKLTVTDYILEAPTIVHTGSLAPNPELGKIGDFYINTSDNTIYGPKPLDIAWNDIPIKY